MKRSLLVVLGAGLVFAPVTLAQTTAAPAKAAETAQPAAKAQPLVAGDKAPALQFETFIKGTPVKEFEKGRVYVVEFWATWCGPCIRAFPHLSKLQADYKDKVTFIGTNVWERGEYNAEQLERVKAFVEKQGEKMAYTVAYDGGAKKMTTTWMDAAEQDGIPACFIVNQEGTIAWIGNPHDEQFETVLAGVVAKTYKVDASAAREEANRKREGTALMTDLAKAVRAKKDDEALAIADKLVAVGGEYGQQGAAWKFGYLLEKKQDAKAAVEFGKSIYEKVAKDSPMLLNQFAWTIVDPEGTVKDKDLVFAAQCAERAVELTKEKDAAILDTLARTYFLQGKKDKAVATQTKAVALAPEEMKAELEASLKEYQK